MRSHSASAPSRAIERPRQGLALAHLDLFLLRCLQALVSEAHVTRAASRMGLTQPAMSGMLRRLRTLCADPILVRTERGMQPTPRAVEMAASIGQAVDRIDRTLAAAAPFDPATTETRFSIAASESVLFVLVPPLLAALRREAPGLRVEVHTPTLARVRQELEEGQADLVVSFLRGAPEGLHTMPLLTQKLKVIAAQRHPEIRGTLSLDQYLASPHVVYTLNRHGGSTIEQSIEAALQQLGRTRTIGAWLPSALSSPPVVAASDMIATIPERVARHVAPLFGLQVLAPPLPLSDVEIAMYWHERMHANPVHSWLRRRLREVAEELRSGA